MAIGAVDPRLMPFRGTESPYYRGPWPTSSIFAGTDEMFRNSGMTKQAVAAIPEDIRAALAAIWRSNPSFATNPGMKRAMDEFGPEAAVLFWAANNEPSVWADPLGYAQQRHGYTSAPPTTPAPVAAPPVTPGAPVAPGMTTGASGEPVSAPSTPPSWWPQGIPWAGQAANSTPTLDLQRLQNEMFNQDFLRRQTFNEFAARPENLAASLMHLGQTRGQVGGYLSQTPMWQSLQPVNPNPVNPGGGFSDPLQGMRQGLVRAGYRPDELAALEPTQPDAIAKLYANVFPSQSGQVTDGMGIDETTGLPWNTPGSSWEINPPPIDPLQGRHAPVRQTLNDFATNNTNRLGLITGLAGFSGTPSSSYWGDFWTAAPKGQVAGSTRWQ